MFISLGQRRQFEDGRPVAMPAQELLAWARLRAVPLNGFEAECIEMLEAAYLKHGAEAALRRAKALEAKAKAEVKGAR